MARRSSTRLAERLAASGIYVSRRHDAGARARRQQRRCWRLPTPYSSRALPYRDPSRLVFVWQTLPRQNVAELEATPFDYHAWRQRVRGFASLGLVSTDSFTLTADGDAERVRGARVTASLMPLLGIAPAIGRAFTPEEDDSAAAPVAILSDSLWKRRYGGNRGLVGRSIRIDGTPHTVVGIMPPRAGLPGPIGGSDELWLPVRMPVEERTNQISHNYVVIARLADGVSLSQAAAELASGAAALALEQPTTHTGLGTRLVSIREQTVRPIRAALLVLLGGAVLLLIVSCANVATLLVVRASSRSQESAVRAALGATRGRLFSLALAEGLILATLGGVAGLVLGSWVLHTLLPLFTDSLPGTAAVSVDARIVSWTIGGVLAIGTVLGIVASAPSSRATLADTLRSGNRAIGSRRLGQLRATLVVAQIAFAVMLLTSAGLMVRSIVRLQQVHPGFSVERILTFRLSLPEVGYTSPARRQTFATELLSRIESAPGITGAALNSRLPLGGSRGANGLRIEGRPPSAGEQLIADQRHVTPGYFTVMSIPLVRGRAFTDRDNASSEPVAMVNRTMAARFWPDGDPLNARVQLTAGPDSGQWIRIVGIVDDVRHVALSRPAVPEMYRPYAQYPVADFTVAVRTADEPAAGARISRASVAAIDRNLPVYDVRTMEERVSRSFAPLRATMLLLVLTASLAAGLAALAVYGSIWYSVTERIPEIGIRVALGATPASVCAGVVSRALLLTAVGGAIGAAATGAIAPSLRGLLFETRMADPATLWLVGLGLAAMAATASIGPARRAMRVDPIDALRRP